MDTSRRTVKHSLSFCHRDASKHGPSSNYVSFCAKPPQDICIGKVFLSHMLWGKSVFWKMTNQQKCKVIFHPLCKSFRGQGKWLLWLWKWLQPRVFFLNVSFSKICVANFITFMYLRALPIKVTNVSHTITILVEDEQQL